MAMNLTWLRDPDKTPSPAQLADAARVRKRLMDSFAQYNVAARRIRDLPTTSATQEKLQKAVFLQASNFLHVQMLPLKALPKIMKHASAYGLGSIERMSSIDRPNSALAAIKYNETETASQASSSSAVSALEAEEKQLRERLIVLEEQSFLVKEQMAQANRRRKFDEVSSLAMNVQELGKEMDHVQGQLAQLDFAGLYSGQVVDGASVR